MNDVTVDGIANSKYLWFYSILGLFRISFEYLNVDFQRHCLQHFTELWLTGCHRSSLPELMTLHYSDCDSLSEVPEASAISEQPPYLHTEECKNASPLLTGTCNCSTSLISDSDPALCTAPSNISKQVNVLSADDVADVSSPTVSVAVDNDCPDAMFHLICSSLQSIQDVDERRRLFASLRVLLQFFEAEYLSADTSFSESSLAFPLHLVEQYTKLVKDDVGFYSSDGYDVGGRRGMWLRLVSEWLGEEFACLRTTINQHVEMFKADNIDRISDLPSPRTVIRHLFPHCMILLMLRWMGDDLPKFRVGQTVDVSPETSEVWSHRESDHSYIADDYQESHLFSFIQLILEFANGCLVSGIAHVLYPRLLQAQL